jgi:multidrug efflux pump subunit AcrB
MPAHLRHSFEKMENAEPSRFRQALEGGIERLRQGPYRKLAGFALEFRFLSVSLALTSLIVMIGMVSSGQIGFKPNINAENDQIWTGMQFVAGTPESEIDAFAEQAMVALTATDAGIAPDETLVKNVVDSRDYHGNVLNMLVTLTPRDKREITNNGFLKAWKSRLDANSWISRIYMGSESGGGSKDANQLRLFLAGDVPLETLEQASQDLQDKLARYPELQEIEDNLGEGEEQLNFSLTPAAHALNISAADISRQIRTALDGKVIQKFVRYGEEMEFIISLPEADRERLNMLAQVPVMTPQGKLVPLGTLVEFSSDQGSASLYHRNGEMGVQVSAKLVSDDTKMNELRKEIYDQVLPQILDRYNLKARFTGNNHQMAEMQRNLATAAIAALVLIYLILAWSFASWSWPIAVILAIPLGITGALAGHWVLGLDLNMLSIFGLFAVGGIIVNDSIILVSRYRELKEEGMERKAAIVEASVQRFRAVILTTLTTVCGLLPILFEQSVNAQLVRSMATSLAFGLSFGTVLVLLIVPCFLSYIESIKALFGRMIHRIFDKKTKVQPEQAVLHVAEESHVG